MERVSALLAICAGNSPVTSEFPAQRPVTRSFDVFFDLPLNKQLSKQSWGWWFATPSRPLWRHCNENANTYIHISKHFSRGRDFLASLYCVVIGSGDGFVVACTRAFQCCRQLDLKEQPGEIWMKIPKTFHSRKCIWTADVVWKSDGYWPIVLSKLTKLQLNCHWISIAVLLNLG